MSSSITIPAPASSTIDYDHRRRSSSKTEVGSSPSSSCCSSPIASDHAGTTMSSRAAQKKKMVHTRRPSLLSLAFSHQECTTINIAHDPDGPPRLISYLSSSQGFAWNPELFLPSYVDVDYTPLEHCREQVVDIFLSDEDVKRILPAVN